MLFRNRDGEVAALFDRCPHRFAPLSQGTISGEAIVCGYHGLAFDGRGRCVGNPHGPAVKALMVRHYPILEAYRGLWIWMGDPEAATDSALGDLSFLASAPASAFSKGYLRGQGNYQLFVDNILDLSHADFLHPTTLGGGALTRARAKVREAGDHVMVHYDCMNETPSPQMKATRNLGDDDRADFWTHVDWSPPAVMSLRSGAVPARTPRDQAGITLNVHIMTPETPSTTHYFFAATRDFALDDIALNERIAQTRSTIFATEDKPMIGAQQERIGDADFWDLNPVLLAIDEGSVRVRRKLKRMIALERNGELEKASKRRVEEGSATFPSTSPI